jgi:hypothetical protein
MYLWTTGTVPPGGSLQLSRLDLEAIELARRWDAGEAGSGPEEK